MFVAKGGLLPYGKKTHLRFQGMGVPPTEGSCRFPLIVLQQDHPVVPCNAQFCYPHLPLDSARGTAAGSACPGDCAPRGNGSHIAAGLGAAASPQTKMSFDRHSCFTDLTQRSA